MAISVDPAAWIFAAVLLLTLPLNWLLAAFFAAAFHELCHILAIRLLGGRIWGLRVRTGGAVIETEPLDFGRELVCALAGPCGSLLLLLCCRWIPRVALCALVQGLFNLLPVYPLDGGRALQCGAGMLLPEKLAGPVCRWIERLVLLGILAMVLWGTFAFRLGILPLLGILMLVIQKNTLQTGATRGTIVLPYVKR